jgi:hypothetical protein
MGENENLNQDPPEGGDLDEGDRTTPESETGGAPETPEGDQPKPETKTEDEPVSREDYNKLAARAAYAERELRRRQRTPEPPAPAGDTPPATEPTRPKPARADYDDYDDWQEAVMDWKIEQRDLAANKKAEQRTVEQRQQDRQKKYEEITAAETAKDPDFLKKAFIPVGALEDLIVESEQMVALALHFGASRENTMEAMRLSDLARTNPAAAAREIGKLEAKLENKSPTPRTETKAPATTKQLGSGTETATKKPEDMTQAEYNKWRDAGGGRD